MIRNPRLENKKVSMYAEEYELGGLRLNRKTLNLEKLYLHKSFTLIQNGSQVDYPSFKNCLWVLSTSFMR